MEKLRYRYFLRTDPPTQEGEPPRVPPDVREHVLDGLRERFDPEPLDYWEAIHVTSVGPFSAERADAVNEEVHRRLAEILDRVEPRWREHYVLIPALTKPHSSPLPRRFP